LGPFAGSLVIGGEWRVLAAGGGTVLAGRTSVEVCRGIDLLQRAPGFLAEGARGDGFTGLGVMLGLA
jgi:hypothetical protein